MKTVARKILASLLAVLIFSSAAQTAQVGRETGFPIPRFVSMRSDKANVRRGPTLEHSIDWVFERAGLPVVVRAEFGHWRLIEDVDGDGGWVHRALISGQTTGLVTKDDVPVLAAPHDDAAKIGIARRTLTVEVTECMESWCQISSGDVVGWMHKSELWGVDASQIDAN